MNKIQMSFLFKDDDVSAIDEVGVHAVASLGQNAVVSIEGTAIEGDEAIFTEDSFRPHLLTKALRKVGAKPDTWYYIEAFVHEDGKIEKLSFELLEERERRLMEEYRAQPWPHPWQTRGGMTFRGLRPTDDLDDPSNWGPFPLGFLHTESGFYELSDLLARGEDESVVRPLFDRAPHLEFSVGTRLNGLEAAVGTVAVESETGRKLVSWVLSRRSATSSRLGGGIVMAQGWEEGPLGDIDGQKYEVVSDGWKVDPGGEVEPFDLDDWSEE